MNILILIFFLLILLAAAAVLFIFLSRASQNNARRAEQARQRMESSLAQGVLASADVVSARTVHTRAADGVNLVRVTLRAQPPEGEEYTAILTWEVAPEAQAYLQPGGRVAVLIDPEDRQRVYPNFSGARISPVE